MFTNKLTPPELERLYVLSEELGEVQQAIGKVLRHGYESGWDGSNNREDLAEELGHVRYAVDLMTINGDVKAQEIEDAMESKAQRIKEFLHFNHNAND